MNAALRSLLAQYNPGSGAEYVRALREIVQQISLLGLWRAGFFNTAAFYGGTAFRMFYGLPRFSEDLDFSLMEPNHNFSFDPYLKSIETELRSMGFDPEIGSKNPNSPGRIESAFIKAETRKAMIEIQAPAEITDRLHKESRLKIKLEADTDPPAGAQYEVKFLLLPIPFHVRLFAPSSLFAGKLHALLCRSWKSRVKGRDFYDFIWFVGMKIPCDLKHLQIRMEKSGHMKSGEVLDRDRLLFLLNEKFKTVDFGQAAQDVYPFIADRQSVDLWTEPFFQETARQILVI